MELDDQAQKVALELLEYKDTNLSASDVMRIAKSIGIECDLKGASKYCNNLFVNNILSVRNGRFHIANAALKHFAKQTGMIKSSR